jgi:hypothetical protein
MQAVHQQQTGDQVVVEQSLHRGLVQDGEDAPQPGAVQVDHLADQRLGPFPGRRTARGTGIEQGLDAIARAAPPVVADRRSGLTVRTRGYRLLLPPGPDLPLSGGRYLCR